MSSLPGGDGCLGLVTDPVDPTLDFDSSDWFDEILRALPMLLCGAWNGMDFLASGIGGLINGGTGWLIDDGGFEMSCKAFSFL